GPPQRGGQGGGPFVGGRQTRAGEGIVREWTRVVRDRVERVARGRDGAGRRVGAVVDGRDLLSGPWHHLDRMLPGHSRHGVCDAPPRGGDRGHEDGGHPMSADPKIYPEHDLESAFKDPYPPPAAGRGALLSTLKHLVREKALVTGPQALYRMNQPDGFDCPGCAWPEPGRVSHFEFCENGAKAIAAARTASLVGRAFFAKHTVTELRTKDGYWLEQQRRLAEPMEYDRASDKYVPISWEDLFAKLGTALRGLADPYEAVCYTSGRTSNEAAFLYQLFGRAFGTNNFPDCSNMCHESSGVALGESVGVGKGTVTLEDFGKADAIFVVGQNPGTNHPRMLSELQHAAKRGGQ